MVCAGTACANAPAASTAATPHAATDVAPPPTVTGPEARAMVAAGATLVDVRDPDEFAAGHIEGAVNIPVDTVAANPDAVGAKDQPLVLYCRIGRRARRAADTLRAAGFTRVQELGAMSNWGK
jgi:phage shock protein E